MPSTYKTPGVYVEEISKFPPSVAAVETAIPAFIGYTERATKDIKGDLLRKPKKITAIAEYERFFGGAYSETTFSANVIDTLDSNSGLLIRSATVPRPTDLSPFMMYYSIRMYFANGGGPCYIISVNTYRDAGGVINSIDADLLGTNTTGNGGLDLLKMEDEPTLIVFPDAQALSDSQFYSLYQAALAQCNELQDRFALIDTKGDEEDTPALLRDNIGTNYLKYGAVYYPFLELVFNYAYKETDVAISHTLESTFAIPATVVGNINPHSVLISDALTVMRAIDVAAAVTAVNSASTKPDKASEIPGIRDAADALRAQLEDPDRIQDQLEIISGEAATINTIFNDQDIQNAIDAINAVPISTHITDLNQIILDADAIIDDEVNNYNNITIVNHIVPVTQALTDIYTLLDSDVDSLVMTLIPNLITAIQGNDPTSLISQISTSVNTIHSAQTALVAIDVEPLVDDVINQGISDVDALTALQGPLAQANAEVLTNLTSLIAAVNASIQTAQNVAQIPLIQSTLTDTVNSIDLTDLSNIHTELNALADGITGIPSALVGDRDGINAFANTFDIQTGLINEALVAILIPLTSLFNWVNYLDLNGNNLSQIENIDNTTYNQIKLEIEKIRVHLPPSSTMAGIYAKVDRDRGVWKAPANVSISSVISPTRKIDNNIQDGLNVDVVAGKSINVLRAFTGKGTLVWGARTLAGNDNEWRYISVRRFFNMVEESSKKATSQFVFEPNDANTWVRVKAMIENFLTVQWRAGALAGAKAEHAFYVKVGLGETMTSLDILEGRMIVEIGMAAVRPAEFIILRFSHKMQES